MSTILMESVLVYAAFPSSVSILGEFVNVLKESGVFVYGFFEDDSYSFKYGELFDQYVAVNKTNIDECIIKYRELGVRMVFALDINSGYLFNKVLNNFNVVSVLYDTRYKSNIFADILKRICPFFKMNLLRKSCAAKDVFESDFIISFSAAAVNKSIKKKYRGLIKKVNYFSQTVPKFIQPPKKDKFLIYIPFKKSDEKLIVKFIESIEEFFSKLRIVIDDREKSSVSLRNYVSFNDHSGLVSFADKDTALEQYLFNSDLVFIPSKSAYEYISEIVNCMGYGRVMIGFKKSLTDEFAGGCDCSFIVDSIEPESIGEVINRVLINNYILERMGEDLFNLHKVKYTREDFINNMKKIIFEYNV